MFTNHATLTAWLTCLVVLLLVCFPPNTRGSAILFQTSASSIKPLITNKLTLTCSLHDTTPVVPVVGRSLASGPEGDADDVMDGEEEKTQTDQQNSDDPDNQKISKKSINQTAENIQYVTSMMISRDGIDLATITEHFPAKPVGGASGFQVSGQIPGISDEKGHLELVFAHPTQTESGNYVCNVATLTSQGRSYYFSQTLEVTDDEVSIKDLVSHVHQMQLEKEKADIKMKEMDTQIGDLSNTIGIMNATIAGQANTIGIMNATIADQANTIGIMKKSDETTIQSLDALRNIARVEPSVFFSAALSSSKTISSNQVVIYDKVICNEGASYSSSTGTFKSPVAGFYHFEFHAFSVNGLSAYLMLRHNGNDVLAVDNEGDRHRGSSNSVTLKLAKDDTVNVAGDYSTSYIYSAARPHYLLNTFSGHLISLV